MTTEFTGSPALLEYATKAELRAGYKRAIEDIAEWSGYAPAYFREKHDLVGCIAGHRAALSHKKEATTNDR